MGINHSISIACDGWSHPAVIEARATAELWRCEGAYEGDGFTTEREAKKSARECGWLIRADGEAFCPGCRKHLKRKAKKET